MSVAGPGAAWPGPLVWVSDGVGVELIIPGFSLRPSRVLPVLFPRPRETPCNPRLQALYAIDVVNHKDDGERPCWLVYRAVARKYEVYLDGAAGQACA
jgi:hypothetical protein